MAAKIALIFFAVFVLFQFFSIQTEATIVRRDASTTEKNDIEEALNSFKQGVEDFVQKIQKSELVQNVTKFAEEVGQKLKNQGDELIHKIKTSTDGKN